MAVRAVARPEHGWRPQHGRREPTGAGRHGHRGREALEGPLPRAALGRHGGHARGAGQRRPTAWLHAGRGEALGGRRVQPGRLLWHVTSVAEAARAPGGSRGVARGSGHCEVPPTPGCASVFKRIQCSGPPTAGGAGAPRAYPRAVALRPPEIVLQSSLQQPQNTAGVAQEGLFTQ